jgi:hypothetical protein
MRKLALALSVACLLSAGTLGQAQVQYKLDMYPDVGTELFNNSFGPETEDNWVANSFQVVDGGTRLVSIEIINGQPLSNQPATVLIYSASDPMDPTSLTDILQSTDTTLTAAAGTTLTILLDTPVDLNVDDIFYAAILLPTVPGTLFPFHLDFVFMHPELSPPFLGRSFFDVGPMIDVHQGGAFDPTMLPPNPTAMGANHPVVDMAQDPGNLVLRVNAIQTPP